MSTMLIQSGTLDDIADAIRSKTGKVASMTPLEMPQEIASISGGGGGVTILSGVSDPTSSQGTDGQIYLKTILQGCDLTTFTNHKESSMTINKSSNEIEFIYGSGGTIGAEVYKQIDLTDIDEIKVTLTMGNKAYQSDFTTRHIKAYIENTINPASNWIGASALTPDAEIPTASTTQTFTFDVSSYTGNYWIVFASHGASSTVTSLLFDGQSDEVVLDSKLKVGGSWQSLVGSDIDDVNLGGGSPVQRITYKNYAKFDTQGIVLPYACNTDYTITCEFYDTGSNNSNALFSATGSNTVSTIIFYLNNASNYAVGTGKGSGSNATMTRSSGSHTIVMNNSNAQTVLDGTQSISFTRNNLSTRNYTVGCQVDSITSVFKEYFKSYKLESLLTGNKICELKPALLYEEFPCLYDSVNDKVYILSGLTVMDTIPT